MFTLPCENETHISYFYNVFGVQLQSVRKRRLLLRNCWTKVHRIL